MEIRIKRAFEFRPVGTKFFNGRESMKADAVSEQSHRIETFVA
jgi:hypothetical protein